MMLKSRERFLKAIRRVGMCAMLGLVGIPVHAQGGVSGKKNLDSLAMLSPREFIARVRTDNNSTDVNRIFELSDAAFLGYISNALNSPTRTEIDTVRVIGRDKYEKYGVYYDASLSEAIYYSNLNLIKLNYYTPGNPSADVAELTAARNSRIQKNWFHENKHAQDWNFIQTVLSRLTTRQIAEIAVHKEIVARAEEEFRTGNKNPEMIMRRVLDDANRIFYLYIKNGQFITDIDYMLDIENAQLGIIYKNNLSAGYPKIAYRDIIRRLYTFDNKCILDDIPKNTRQLLNDIVNGTLNFPEFDKQFSELCRKKSDVLGEIKNKQNQCFEKSCAPQLMIARGRAR